MAIPITQWEAVGGVAHAWIAQCEGYVSLCGREVSGLQGQRSGIRCGQCALSTGWAEQTGESSYLTPQKAMAHVDNPPRVRPRRQRPQTLRQASMAMPALEPSIIVPPEPPRPETPAPALQAPETRAAYASLPVVEQHYWAPVMLARAGQEAVWDQGQETAAQFQERCYERLRTGVR